MMILTIKGHRVYSLTIEADRYMMRIRCHSLKSYFQLSLTDCIRIVIVNVDALRYRTVVDDRAEPVLCIAVSQAREIETAVFSLDRVLERRRTVVIACSGRLLDIDSLSCSQSRNKPVNLCIRCR